MFPWDDRGDGHPSDTTLLNTLAPVLVAHGLLIHDGQPVRGSGGLKTRDHHSAVEWSERSIDQTEIESLARTGSGLYRRGHRGQRRSVSQWLVALSVWGSRVRMPLTLSCRMAVSLKNRGISVAQLRANAA
ncbi:hypothetical protein PoB_005623000 [Plakobranchus ocellatus]|uniref:Uncharacterized protein n=1 Tax=Plakobranchus ocellatus TaxID=259542 RepID=A0AAV4CAI6_9GAST|nr:hypothetical protein PoB_005623000 [Plakobranchus ocellatus]